MKKFIALFTLITFLFTTNASYALTELYYVKNATKAAMDNSMQNYFIENNYTLKKVSPFYAVSNKDNSKYSIVVLQQSGVNLFYYYTSNNNDKKVHKAFLKDLSSRGLVYEQSTNQDLLDNFEKIAQKTLTGTTTTYSFEDKRYSNSSASAGTQTYSNTPQSVLSGYVANVGRGSKLQAYLQNPINTATAKSGDLVEAVLKEDWIINNKVIAPQGSVVYGALTRAKSASIGMQSGKIQISFYKIVTPDNVSYDLETQNIDFNVENEGVVANTAGKAVAGAAIGALLGLAIGALSKDGNVGRSVAIGAGIGAGGALVESGLQKGVDAEIPSYTDLEIIVEKDIRVVFSN